METTTRNVNSAQDLFESGQFLDAYVELGKLLPGMLGKPRDVLAAPETPLEAPEPVPIDRIHDPEHLALAIRTCDHLRLKTRSNWLSRRLFREQPTHPWAWRCRILMLSERGRIFDALRMLRAGEEGSGETQVADEPYNGHRPELQTDFHRVLWASTKAGIYAELRDFDAAQRAVDQIFEAIPDHPWGITDQAWLMFRRDQVEESLALAGEHLSALHGFVSLHHTYCYILHESNRVAEAIAAYTEANDRFQSPNLHAGLAHCLIEDGQVEKGRQLLETYATRFPIYRNKKVMPGVNSWLARVCRALGDNEAALEFAEKAGKHGEEMAGRLRKFLKPETVAAEGATSEATETEAKESKPPEPEVPIADKRVRLAVPFVRQGYLTCAPATLSSILAYFNLDVDQATIADEITYDGTPDYKKKQWCEDNGLIVRFFQFTPEAGRDLIDRGLPFTISTRYPRGAHMQGVIGYDQLLGIWFFREPGYHAVQEADEAELVKLMAARGGNCALVVPESHAHLMPPQGSLPFEDESLAIVEMDQALHHARLEEARQVFERLQDLPPTPLRWDAERSLVLAREDFVSTLEITRAQFEKFPEDSFTSYVLACDLDRAELGEEHLEFLTSQVDQEHASPLLALDLAGRIRDHAPERERARRLVRRAARRMREQSEPVRAMADICWDDEPDRKFACELYRIAAAMTPHDESLALAYFRACNMMGLQEEGLSYLRERCRSLVNSAVPAGTLARALDENHLGHEAKQVLREGLDREEHPWLRALLFDQLLDNGEVEQAEEFLAESEGKLKPVVFWRSRFRLMYAMGKKPEALAALEEARKLSPQDDYVLGHRLRMLLAVEGPEVAHVEALAMAAENERYPHLTREAYDMLRRLGELEEAERLMRKMVQDHPNEAWLKGILGRHLIEAGKPAEGLEFTEKVLELLPDSIAALNDLGDAKAQLGDRAAAAEAWRKSLGVNASQVFALHQLLQMADGPEQAAAELEFVQEQFLKNCPGDGALKQFLSLAGEIWERDQLRELLLKLGKEFPGLPTPLEALCRHHLQDEDFEAARELAEQLRKQLPWRDEPVLLLARSLRGLDKEQEAKEIVHEVLEQRPGLGRLWVYLGERYQKDGDLASAQKTFRDGIASNPGNEVLHAFLAEVCWMRGERDESIQLLRRACELDPHYDWAFDELLSSLHRLDRDEEALQLAADRAERQPTRSAVHQAHANALREAGQHEESMAALRRALERDPRLGDARAELIRGLGNLGRTDAAREVLEEGLRLVGEEPQLEAFRGWLMRRDGDHDGSRAELRKVLDRHPDYRSGWTSYLDWLVEDGRGDDILTLYDEKPEAALEFAVFWGYAADELLRVERHEEGETALRKAIELDGEYYWARNRLGIRLHESGRYEEEAKVLAPVEDPDTVAEYAAALIVRNACKVSDRDRARKFYLRILRQPDVDMDSLRMADGAMHEFDKPLRRDALQEASAKDNGNATVMNLVLIMGIWDDKETFLQRLTAHAKERLSPKELADVLAKAMETPMRPHLAKWVKKNIKPPVEDVGLLGVLAWVLESNADSKAGIEYVLPGYKKPGMEGWMLANLSDSLRRARRFREMREVSDYALTLPRDHSIWWHRVNLAYAHYLDGDLERAEELAVVPVGGYHTPKIDGLAVRLLADMERNPGFFKRRRILARAVPEYLAIYDEAGREGQDPDNDDFAKDALYKKIFCDVTLLMLLGDWGRKILRKFYR